MPTEEYEAKSRRSHAMVSDQQQNLPGRGPYNLKIGTMITENVRLKDHLFVTTSL
jgi:hypothetical protein